MILLRIGDERQLLREEWLWCRDLARKKNEASDRAGSRSEATRFTKQSPQQIHEVSAVGEKGFEKMTGCQMDGSAFHRVAIAGENSLTDFRLPGIGKVELKSTVYADVDLRVPKESIDPKAPPDAFALTECHCRIVSCQHLATTGTAYYWWVTFCGVISARDFFAKAILREEYVQAGGMKQRYWCARKHLSHLSCTDEGQWRIAKP